MIQIGNEGGILPQAVVIPPKPIGYEYSRPVPTLLNVTDQSLLLMPAERADIVIDFSAYAGKTLILYNDAPAPMPLFDERNDLYTGAPDWRAIGGAWFWAEHPHRDADQRVWPARLLSGSRV
jgi:hypothetical protein